MIFARPPCWPRCWDLPDVVHLLRGGHWLMTTGSEQLSSCPLSHRERPGEVDSRLSCWWHINGQPLMTRGVFRCICAYDQNAGDMKLRSANMCTYWQFWTLTCRSGAAEVTNKVEKFQINTIYEARISSSNTHFPIHSNAVILYLPPPCFEQYCCIVWVLPNDKNAVR